MKIYTKTGDAGETGLFGGTRVPKHSPRLNAYGTIDELNAALGCAVSLARSQDALSEIANMLENIQHTLFCIGSHLSTPYDSVEEIPTSLPPFKPEAVTQLEHQIDSLQAALPELTQFILPGGHPAAASIHLARTICRRAERNVIELQQTNFVLPQIIMYLNRLSDFLFVAARTANYLTHTPETPWEKP